MKCLDIYLREKVGFRAYYSGGMMEIVLVLGIYPGDFSSHFEE